MPPTDEHPWHYVRAPDDRIKDVAIFAGDVAPDLGTHFHEEAQLVLVLSGRRVFEVGRSVVAVPAGHVVYFPPMVPHRSLAVHSPDTRCVNLYIEAQAAWPKKWLGACRPLADALANLFPSNTDALRATVQQLAARRGMSREAFTRRFTRELGLSPRAFLLGTRLNCARRLLRGGSSIAAAAAEAGFADQSHLGRCFRKAFGTTPAAYRNGVVGMT
jgi:AraC-like DNA-binding protein